MRFATASAAAGQAAGTAPAPAVAATAPAPALRGGVPVRHRHDERAYGQRDGRQRQQQERYGQPRPGSGPVRCLLQRQVTVGGALPAGPGGGAQKRRAAGYGRPVVNQGVENIPGRRCRRGGRHGRRARRHQRLVGAGGGSWFGGRAEHLVQQRFLVEEIACALRQIGEPVDQRRQAYVERLVHVRRQRGGGLQKGEVAFRYRQQLPDRRIAGQAAACNLSADNVTPFDHGQLAGQILPASGDAKQAGGIGGLTEDLLERLTRPGSPRQPAFHNSFHVESRAPRSLFLSSSARNLTRARQASPLKALARFLL